MAAAERSARTTLVLVGLMCALPFLQPRHTLPITSFYSEWLAAALGVAALAAACAGWRSAAVRLPKIAATPAVLAGMLVLQYLIVDLPYAEPSLTAAAYLVWAGMVMIVVASARDTVGPERAIAGVAAFVLAGAVASSVVALLQCYTPRGALEPLVATRLGVAVYGNLGQPNHFADQLALGLASLALLYARQRVGAAAAALLAAPMLFAMALAGSRSAWLYLVVIVVAAGLASRGDRTPDTRRAFACALALLPAFAVANALSAVPWLAPGSSTSTFARWTELWGTQSDRLQLWQEAWDMFLSAPWTGGGWGQFASRHFAAQPGAGVPLIGFYNNAHNIALQLLAETGVMFVAVAAYGIACWVAFAWRFLTSSPGWWVSAVLGILAIHSMLEYPLWNFYFLGIAAVALGLGEVRHGPQLAAKTVGRVGLAALLLSTASIALTLRDYRRLEIATREHVRAQDIPDTVFFHPYIDLARLRTLRLDAIDLTHKLELSGRVIRHLPTGVAAYRHSLLLALHRDEEEARAIAQHAVTRYPDMLRAYITEAEASDFGDRGEQRRYVEMLRALQMRQNTAGSRAPL